MLVLLSVAFGALLGTVFCTARAWQIILAFFTLVFCLPVLMAVRQLPHGVEDVAYALVALSVLWLTPVVWRGMRSVA